LKFTVKQIVFRNTGVAFAWLQEEKYESLLDEMKKEKIKWQTVTPANKR
jgi:hypothetical protein